MQWIFNKRQINSANKNQVDKYSGFYTLTISAADKLLSYSREELLEICLKELNNAIPESGNAKLLHSKILIDKRATVCITPDNENSRPENRTSISNFFIAGDWTNTGLPATLESAALSGFKAAEILSSKSSEMSP